MSVFHVLETHHPYPQAIAVTLDWHPQPDSPAWNIRAKFDQEAQALSLLAGHIKVVLRGGKLTLRANGAQFTPSQTLPSPLGLGHHSGSESQWQIKFSGLSDFDLGTVTPTADTAHLQATFTITPSDLAIAESQGLWPPDFSPNQLAIADRLIAHWLVHDWFPPALSWGQWAIGAVPPWQTLDADYAEPDPEVRQQKEISLGDRLKELAQAPNLDLIALAQLVGLDPQRDLAGGKFVGVNLNGIDLSNAALTDSNFRGAILTDADLSGANLAGSNFRGADLSGAYLEGANLIQTDFRKSSLALANLIGADLTQANLQETALTNANFSAANLSQAQFGENPGLTPEQQGKLMEQGATFSPEPGREMLS